MDELDFTCSDPDDCRSNKLRQFDGVQNFLQELKLEILKTVNESLENGVIRVFETDPIEDLVIKVRREKTNKKIPKLKMIQ